MRNKKDFPTFHLPTQDIDDWNETSRPYAVGFAYIGLPQIVEPGRLEVSVESRASEDDLFGNDSAWGYGVIPLPAGRMKESVSNQTFRIDCSPSSAGSKLHYPSSTVNGLLPPATR